MLCQYCCALPCLPKGEFILVGRVGDKVLPIRVKCKGSDRCLQGFMIEDGNPNNGKVAPDGQVCSALCWLSARTSPSSPALYPLLCALLPCSVTPGGKLKSCFQLYIDSDFFHLIEGLNRRENLIQRPLFKVVVVNTV